MPLQGTALRGLPLRSVRARANGEKEKRRKKQTKTTGRTDFALFGKNEDGAQTQDTGDKNLKIKNQIEPTVEVEHQHLMHRPAVVEAAPSPEKRGECAHTAGRPYSAAARAPVS